MAQKRSDITKSTGRLRFCLGVVLASALLLGVGETYLRLFPPEYLHPYLGNESPLAGPLVADVDFGVGFASWEDLQKDNPITLGPRSPLQPHSPLTTHHSPRASETSRVWLVLGSSFGYELAHRMRREVTEWHTLNLDRRERLTVRMAQIKTLLESGCRPAHIFLVVIPPDFTYLCEHKLEHHRANVKGGLVFEPRLPAGPWSALVTQSRLAFSGWARLGLQRDQPFFKTGQLGQRISDDLRDDLKHLFAALGRTQRQHAVPLTVIMIPARRELLLDKHFALEEALVSILRSEGIHYLDPRPAFLAQARPVELYVPDGHLSELGNMIVLGELLKEVRRYPPSVIAAAGRARP